MKMLTYFLLKKIVKFIYCKEKYGKVITQTLKNIFAELSTFFVIIDTTQLINVCR